ncbi:hypothetical protein PTSG_04396 [Salpingoeca rosetta]|uniref:Uncharacterized protein n=1 Tax=Salpingoeca rosetta (strain ATCC 50818 / BSB-021) TaxID=946362 RepID=F2U8F7_SALR5|nr:uncharacterized protein PTSG_04396 [Salpingoeca rosetta]EGD72665.1 hypothetical protein PTSG_04396 [Salpingoeca rosetta]|eukprot:XP_004994488.1 hypothetical protein PTSG_04396 [Salpingoeca rosetta]
MKKRRSINLDNFLSPGFAHSERVLTSPRSLRACKALSVKPVDLLPPRVEDFVSYDRHGHGEDLTGLRAFESAQQAHTRLLRLAKIQRQRYCRGTQAAASDVAPLATPVHPQSQQRQRHQQQRHQHCEHSAQKGHRERSASRAWQSQTRPAAATATATAAATIGPSSSSLLRALVVRHSSDRIDLPTAPRSPAPAVTSTRREPTLFASRSQTHSRQLGRHASTSPSASMRMRWRAVQHRYDDADAHTANMSPPHARFGWEVADATAMAAEEVEEEAAAVEAYLREAPRETHARMEKALLHPSNQRQNIGHTYGERARHRRGRDERRTERESERRQRRHERRQQGAEVRREEVLHLQAMRRHVEQRTGMASVRHHPAFVSLGGDTNSCFFHNQ